MEKGDFLLISFEGKDENGRIFDSTKGELGKKIYGKEGPILVILGDTPLLKGMEEALYSMKEGEEREIILPPSKAFGERKKENLIVVPLSNFSRTPKKGEIVTLEGEGIARLGVISSISSGRVVVDTNHPFAGKTVYFKIKIEKHITSPKEKARFLLANNGFEFEEKENSFLIKTNLSEEEKGKVKDFFARFGLDRFISFSE